MWAGNVPSDTSDEELWKFFNKSPDSSEGTEGNAGVSSVFLIGRSNCAFVNFDTEAHLNAAITRFNDQKIRPDDPKCQSLVCRVRKKTDDLRAGVGGQRGVGLHTKWIQERKQKARMAAKSPVDDVNQGTSNPSLTSDEESGGGGDSSRSFEQSSGSGSFASTTSSVLAQYFPKRYFILKSLTQVSIYIRIPSFSRLIS
jgi:RNA recognition motif-containing protein